MLSRKSLAKFVGINVIFGSLACLQYYLMMPLSFWSLLPATLAVYAITLGKNYLILGIEEFYASFKPWIWGEKRQQPKARYWGEFHVYWWMATLVESLTVVFIVKAFSFAPEPVGWGEYGLSYLWFFPIMFVFELIFDFFHYWAHRKSHYGPLYKYLHKTHHMHRYPTGIITFYQHPIDLVLSNSIPTILAFYSIMVLMGIPFNLFQMSLLSVFKTMVELGGHLGRKMAPASSCPQFFWLPRWLGFELYVEDHDIHHTDFNYNFSKRFALWDKLFGTYKQPPSLSMEKRRESS